MATRMIRGGFLDSSKIEKLNADEERLYVRLMLVADDFGRSRAQPELVRSLAFPLKPDIRTSDVRKWLDKCAACGLILLYTVNETPYLEIVNFNQRLRTMKSKCPAPNDAGQLSDRCPTDVRHLSFPFSSLLSSSSTSETSREGGTGETPDEAAPSRAEPLPRHRDPMGDHYRVSPTDRETIDQTIRQYACGHRGKAKSLLIEESITGRLSEALKAVSGESEKSAILGKNCKNVETIVLEGREHGYMTADEWGEEIAKAKAQAIASAPKSAAERRSAAISSDDWRPPDD